MWHFNNVIAIEYRRDYVYLVRFDDGAEADVDFSHYLDRGPVFEPLRDPAYFQLARLDGGAIAWPNGADIAPDTLYEQVRRARDGHR